MAIEVELPRDTILLRELLAKVRELMLAVKRDGEFAVATVEWCGETRAKQQLTPTPLERNPFVREDSLRGKGAYELAPFVVRYLSADAQDKWKSHLELADANAQRRNDRYEELVEQQVGPFSETVDSWVRSNPDTADSEDVRDQFALRGATLELESEFKIEAESAVAVLNALVEFESKIVDAIDEGANGSIPRRDEPTIRKTNKGKRGGKTTVARDIKLWDEFCEGLESGQWCSRSEFADFKKMKRPTVSKALDRGEAAKRESNPKTEKRSRSR